MLQQSLYSYEFILVPDAMDAIVLNAHGVNAISLVQILTNNLLLVPCPFTLSFEQKNKLVTYFKNVSLVGLAGFYQYQSALIEQILGCIASVLIYSLEPVIQKSVFSMPLKDQALLCLKDYQIIACDNKYIAKMSGFNYLCTLFETKLGQNLYKTAQYLTFQDSRFINSNLVQAFKDMSFYYETLSFKELFQEHIRIINPTYSALSVQFNQFLANCTTMPSNYLLALGLFLKQQISLRTPRIYPISTMRFFQQADIALGVEEFPKNINSKNTGLETCMFDQIYVLSKNEKMHNISKIYAQIKPKLSCSFIMTPSQFLNKTIIAKDAHKNEHKNNYIFHVKNMLKGENPLTTSSISAIARLKIQLRYKQIKQQLELFKQEQNIKKFNFVDKNRYLNYEQILLTYKPFAHTDSMLIQITNTLITKAEIALIFKIYPEYEKFCIITPKLFKIFTNNDFYTSNLPIN